MKNTLLLIFILFIVKISFASISFEVNPFFTADDPQDTTQVNVYELQKIKLYPNPVSDYLNIDYDIIFVKDAKIQIYNTIGSIVYSKKLENKHDYLKISVSDFEAGLYFCSLQIDGKLLNTKKFLINHH